MDDDRFKHVFTDPIFKPTSKKNRKVVLEKRFKSVLKDKKYNNFSKYDSRGKVITTENNLTKYYQLEDESAPPSEAESLSEESATSSDSGLSDLPGEARETTSTSNRLALCGVDWEMVDAKICMNLFRSFLPEKGNLVSVKIFKSDFGERREERENQRGLGNAREAKRRVSRYERERLLYFYAVLEFDSAESADWVYEQCDGREMELTGCSVDLRFVPDDVTFEKEPTDFCDTPGTLEDYEVSRPSKSSVQSKGVPLWDRTDARREGLMMKAFELGEADFGQLLGTRSSDESGEAERELLLGGDVEQPNYKFGRSEAVQPDISWHFGDSAEEKEGQHGSGDSDEPGGHKARGIKRRKAGKVEQIDVEKDEPTEFKARGRKRRKGSKAEEIDVEGDEPTEFKASGRKRRKGSKAAQIDLEGVDKLKSDILGDSRFKALLCDPKYNIDASSHEYKSTHLYEALRDEVVARKSTIGDPVSKEEPSKIAEKLKRKISKMPKLF